MDVDSTEKPSKNDASYFGYYAHLQHQQNMLQDFVRTSTYKTAITQLSSYSITNKLVMDVGAGSGILSFFAAQSGANKVYAIEASNMADKMQIVLDCAKNTSNPSNSFLADKIEIIKGKIEEITHEIPQVDTIISEPIGVLLLHERMLESYIYARDKYLKKDGTMCPSMGTICLAPVTDSYLWAETMTKARFWQQSDYYGVDLTPLANEASKEYFTSPVVGCFNPNSIMCTEPSITQHQVDFYTIEAKDMLTINIPIVWEIKYTGIIHAIGGWFDCEFNLPLSRQGEIIPHDPQFSFFSQPQPQSQSQSQSQQQEQPDSQKSPTYLPITLSTSPSHTPTHWQQVRFLLPEPIAVNYGQKVIGNLLLTVNEHRSYDLHLDFAISNGYSSPRHRSDTNEDSNAKDAKPLDPNSINPNSRKHATWYLNEQVYNYSYNSDASQDFKPENMSLYSPN